ncbi:MAG: hypothetical protein WBD02_00830 [Acidimicrobiia bacterium]
MNAMKLAALTALALGATACPIPEQPAAAAPPATAISVATPDGTGYVQPRISSDGTTVLYRREADQNRGYAVSVDLIANSVGSPLTTVAHNVGDLLAVSPNGRFVVHSVIIPGTYYGVNVYVRDLLLGTEVKLPDAPSRDSVAIAQSGGNVTIAWNITVYNSGNCPCLQHLKVWQAPEIGISLGKVTLDKTLDSAPWTWPPGSFYGAYVGLTADGQFAFEQNWKLRQIEKFSTATGAKSIVPLQWPAFIDRGIAGAQEWITFSSADGSTFYLDRNDLVSKPALLKSGQPAVEIEPESALSANAQWGVKLVTTPGPRPDGKTISLVRTEIATGVTRTIVSGEEALNNTDYFKFYSVSSPLAVSDSGKVTFGFWRAPLAGGTWPPSQIFIDG